MLPLAGFGDAHLLDASGANDEDDVVDGYNPPHNYLPSASFYSESGRTKNKY